MKLKLFKKCPKNQSEASLLFRMTGDFPVFKDKHGGHNMSNLPKPKRWQCFIYMPINFVDKFIQD